MIKFTSIDTLVAIALKLHVLLTIHSSIIYVRRIYSKFIILSRTAARIFLIPHLLQRMLNMSAGMQFTARFACIEPVVFAVPSGLLCVQGADTCLVQFIAPFRPISLRCTGAGSADTSQWPSAEHGTVSVTHQAPLCHSLSWFSAAALYAVSAEIPFASHL